MNKQQRIGNKNQTKKHRRKRIAQANLSYIDENDYAFVHAPALSKPQEENSDKGSFILAGKMNNGQTSPEIYTLIISHLCQNQIKLSILF